MAKKLITILLVLLFSMIIMDQTRNNFFPTARANSAFSGTEKDPVNPNMPVLYSPEDLGMSSVRLARIDSIVKNGIKARVFPGCQVLVLKEGKPVYDRCFGNYTYEATQKVKPTTMYDLASLSKTTGTLLAIMKLYDERQTQTDR